ncbi:hypothetical protein [Vibrio hippocampi]|uniref:hypothetical protein n=1 Tax=Vibrio hippocampi TaxID=654686 RepID=UPI003F49F8C9
MAIRLGHLTDSSMMAKQLASRQIRVCASPDYLKKYGEPYSLSELELHICLVEILQAYRQGQQGIWAVYPNNRHLSTKVRRLIEFLTKGLRGAD